MTIKIFLIIFVLGPALLILKSILFFKYYLSIAAEICFLFSGRTFQLYFICFISFLVIYLAIVNSVGAEFLMRVSVTAWVILLF